MSEYWVSKNKYYCTYCNIYIADDKPSRLAHETGLRHKGNYDRKIREMYKKSERETREKAAEAKEIARMDAAAHAAMIKDGLAVGSTSAAPPPPPPKPKAADPFANYSSASDLGFLDKEEEKRKAQELLKQAEDEAAAELEREMRQKEGTIGQWERIVKKRVPPPPQTANLGDVKPGVDGGREGDGEGGDAVEREEPIPTNVNFLKEKKGFVDDDEYDPTKIAINLKRKRLTLKEENEIKEAKEAKERIKREAEEAELRRIASERRNETTTAGWNSVELKYEPMFEFEPLPEVKAEEETGVKEEEGLEAKAEAEGSLKVEAEEVKPVVSSGFKKRKMHGAGAARRKP